MQQIISYFTGYRTVKINKHKEEMPAQINADDKVRQSVIEVLSLCIDPLKPQEDQSEGIGNITSRLVCNNIVNADTSFSSGLSNMNKFEESWSADSIKLCSPKL